MSNNIINGIKANRLYWLGRYAERVYLTLHLLRKCYDGMIDSKTEQYKKIAACLDINNSYSSNAEFVLGMMYDEENPSSIISSLNRAMDNAIMLRDDIKSETMSYIEMSVAQIRRYSDEAMRNVTNLQPLTDWALAFWGSISQRVDDTKIKALLAIGQNVERMDIYLRFDYSYERIADKLYIISQWQEEMPNVIDAKMAEVVNEMLQEKNINAADSDSTYRYTLTKYVNQLVKV